MEGDATMGKMCLENRKAGRERERERERAKGGGEGEGGGYSGRVGMGV